MTIPGWGGGFVGFCDFVGVGCILIGLREGSVVSTTLTSDVGIVWLISTLPSSSKGLSGSEEVP